MSRVYHRNAARPWPTRKIVKVVVGLILLVPLLGAGTIAELHLSGLHKPHPLLRLVIVEGESMEPTFHPGQQLLFVRRPWRQGSIVIADTGDSYEVVKRVVTQRGDTVVITGDNRAVTASYALPSDKIIATFCCRTGLKFAPPQLRKQPASSPDN
jgi:signal peptidase I